MADSEPMEAFLAGAGVAIVSGVMVEVFVLLRARRERTWALSDQLADLRRSIYVELLSTNRRYREYLNDACNPQTPNPEESAVRMEEAYDRCLELGDQLMFVASPATHRAAYRMIAQETKLRVLVEGAGGVTEARNNPDTVPREWAREMKRAIQLEQAFINECRSEILGLEPLGGDPPHISGAS